MGLAALLMAVGASHGTGFPICKQAASAHRMLWNPGVTGKQDFSALHAAGLWAFASTFLMAQRVQSPQTLGGPQGLWGGDEAELRPRCAAKDIRQPRGLDALLGYSGLTAGAGWRQRGCPPASGLGLSLGSSSSPLRAWRARPAHASSSGRLALQPCPGYVAGLPPTDARWQCHPQRHSRAAPV